MTHLDRRALLAGFTALSLAPHAAAQDRVGAARTALAPDGPVDRALAALASEGRFAGVAYASINGAPVLARAFGMANRERGEAHTVESRFNVASMGKMFTAVAIGQLIERGALGLDDPALRHRPDLSDCVPERATIAHLLSHTSGLGSYFGSPLWAERGGAARSIDNFLALIRHERVAPDYDGAYRYSNSGYVVLGAIIERVTRQDYYAHVSENVFARAGMRNSAFASHASPGLATGYSNGCFARPPSQCTPSAWTPTMIGAGRGSPAGGSYSTAPDMDAFAQALRTGRLMRAETFDLMKTARVQMPMQGGPLDAYCLGFGRLTVNGQALWGHNGGTIGWGCQMDCVETAPINLIVMTNQDAAQRPGSAALRQALA